MPHCMTNPSKFLSQPAYAIHRKQLGLPGASHAAAAKAMGAGRLVRASQRGGAKLLLAPKVADAEWARTRTA